MSAKLKYEALATTGEYKDRQTGETKKRYTRVGSVFEQDDGRLSLKLDCVPVGQGWSGWISFFPPRDRDQPQQRKSRPENERYGAPQGNAGGYQEDDEIPF